MSCGESVKPAMFDRSLVHNGRSLRLAARPALPANTAALLIDMDGVLLDILTLDYEVVDVLLGKRTAGQSPVGTSAIRRNFGHDPAEFWRRIVAEARLILSKDEFDALVQDYRYVRRVAIPRVHNGVAELILAARHARLRIAVVSNNPERDVVRMLSNTALLDHVDEVVGNDGRRLQPKPAPDLYLVAARRLSLHPAACVVIEASLIGAEAGRRAGCFTIGVATGANTLDELQRSRFTALSYSSLAGSDAA
jgi:HAD superfamily hydrolase (TIGR01509 family)